MTDSNEWAVSATGDAIDREGWPLRPLVLAAIGAVSGLAVHLLLNGKPFYAEQLTALQLAAIAALIVGAGIFGFTLERRGWMASLIFSLAAAAVAGGVLYWNGAPEAWSGGDGWRGVSLALGLAIATPLFQAARDQEALRFRYASVHDHAWANIVLWCACWAFVGVVFLLMVLLSELFHLITLNFLRDLLREQWFVWALIGLAFGGALGLFREHDAVVRLLYRVAATVLAVLAPVLGVGLAIFLLALPFTGLGPLWDSWVAATPLLLLCVLGALILSNTVIGSTPEQESRIAVLRYGAMALAGVMLPLAILAAVATGLRIDQYGFSPERLWALTFVVIATAVGLAYLASLVRGRLAWALHARPANLHIAIAVCLIALVLATPLVSFNAISTNDQVARLESGRLTPDKFDWHALAWDFGKPGRNALDRLAKSGNAAIRDKAVAARKSERWERIDKPVNLAMKIRLLPQDSVLTDDLRQRISRLNDCSADNGCTLVFLPGGAEALLFQDSAFPTPNPNGAPGQGYRRAQDARRFVLTEGKWADAPDDFVVDISAADQAALATGYQAGKVEVRSVQRRRIFVGGVAVGEPFE